MTDFTARPTRPPAAAPQFGQLLAPILGDLQPNNLAAFLARLERGAAMRYRSWARALPAWAGELLHCAAAEDEIADRVGAAFVVSADVSAELDRRLPAALDIYGAAFDGLDDYAQLALQAQAERQGASAWRTITSQIPDLDNTVRAELAACSALEELSAARLDALLARPPALPSAADIAGVVTHETERALEGWTTSTGERLTWRTLLSADRDPTRSFAAGVTEIPASPDSLPVHRHAPDELYYVERGRGDVIIDGVEHPVEPGSAVFVPGGAWHGVRNLGPDPIRLFYVFPTASFTDVVYEYPAGQPAPIWDTRH